MKLIKYAFSSVLLSSAFVAGVTIGIIANKQKILEKFKKMTIKKNTSASSD